MENRKYCQVCHEFQILLQKSKPKIHTHEKNPKYLFVIEFSPSLKFKDTTSGIKQHNIVMQLPP